MTPSYHQQQLGPTILFVCIYGLKAKVFFYLAAVVSLEFESQPRQTLVITTGSDSSSAKRSALGVSVTGPRK